MRCAYTFWTYARAHDRVYVSDMHTTVWTFLNGRFGRTRRAHGLAVCGARLGWARGSEVRGARLRRDTCAHGRVHGSVVMHRLVAMHIRIAHGLNFMDDWAMWLNFRNGHMQLKAMELKVGMQNNIGGKKNQQGVIYVFNLFSLVFSFTLFFLLLGEKQSLILGSKGKNSFLAGRIHSFK